MSSPRQRALAAIDAAGADFNEYGGPGQLLGDAYTPAGIVWSATLTHALAVVAQVDRQAGWRAFAEDLTQGTEPCRQPDCDTCADATGPAPFPLPR